MPSVLQAITTNSTNIATNTTNIATNSSGIATNASDIGVLNTKTNNLQVAINSLPSYNSMVLSGIGATLSTAYSQILISATIVTQSTNPALLNFNTTTGIITINGYGTFILLANGSINPIGSGTRTLNFQIRNAVGGAVVSTASITVGANEGAFSIANAFTIDATTFPTLPLTINTYASDNSGTSTYTNPSYTLSLNTNGGGGGGIITSDQVQNASTAVGATVTEALTSNTTDITNLTSSLSNYLTTSSAATIYLSQANAAATYATIANLSAYVPTSQKNTANGVAGLDGTSKILTSALPAPIAGILTANPGFVIFGTYKLFSLGNQITLNCSIYPNAPSPPGTNYSFATLPVGFRPVANVYCTAVPTASGSSNVNCSVIIQSSGIILVNSTATLAAGAGIGISITFYNI